MSEAHLLLISIGPVQDFIAQARRTRDLWFGSHLLSELSRATAKAVAAESALLIFPALDADDNELEPCDEPTRTETGEPPVSVANKILAECPAGVDPKLCAMQARAALQKRWREIADSVRTDRGRNLLAEGIEAVWNEQIEEVLEFYAVWAPLSGSYEVARKEVEHRLAGRKNLRDFKPWRHGREGAPKSSLDGARVSVLCRDRTHADFRRFGIGETEQLDAIGVVKRTGFQPEQFVVLFNVAAGAWIAEAVAKAGPELRALARVCAEAGVPRIRREIPLVTPFPFDATALYPQRWPALPDAAPLIADTETARQWGERHVRPLLRVMGSEPPSYVACLVADGDRMGRAINHLDSVEASRAFSRQLAQFPQQARKIVEEDHLGSLVYAGGDDVLAFLPVARALDCAKALAKDFGETLRELVPEELAPTLSVGIGVGHVMDTMSTLLALGRDAERAAKNAGRNALAVIVDKRSGGRRQFALPWLQGPVERLRRDQELLDGRLATGKLYELEDLLRRFPDPTLVRIDTGAAGPALHAYATDVLLHSREGRDGVPLGRLGVPAQADYAGLRQAIQASVDRILVAHLMRGCQPS